ncbi:MAG: hypothetical protein KDC79_15590 [Cyclobacteriaceae bacterium]|nr:hypothetical protein [Cyclobacteriaceae bacterium]
MSTIRLRPRIRLFSQLDEKTVVSKYKSILDSNNYPFEGKVVEHHIFIKFRQKEYHFWSPELTLEVVRNYLQDDAFSDQKEPTLIRGYISPRPSLWTFFAFAYIGLGLLFLGFIVYGTSQMMLDLPTNMLWYALICLIFLAGVFIATQIGQRLGDEQTNKLLEFVNEGIA